MKDPFPLPAVPALAKAIEPFAESLGLRSLPAHIHEVVLATLFYTFIHLVVSPVASTWLFGSTYPRHSRARRINWDSHVVSLVQSVLINILALWVMHTDEERKGMDWEQRVWGYTGGAGFVQAMVVGYFVWDLIVSLIYFDVFGAGVLAHAMSALVVYSFGFRPLLNYYGCVFILYEISTPFLNFHWFFDKLGMTGSTMQLINGITLLVTFFGCRLVWGIGQSLRVFVDLWYAARLTPDAGYIAATVELAGRTSDDPLANTMAFALDPAPVPVKVALCIFTSNMVLHALNVHWFFKMIKAVRKRFPAEGSKEKGGPALEKTAAAGGATTSAAAALDADELRRRNILDVLPSDIPQ